MHPVPGVSTYKLEKSLDEINKILEKNKSKKISYGEKRYFHEDTSYLSARVPGAGFYNPHDEINKQRKSSGDWKMWTTKHAKWDKVVAKREAKVPAPGTYAPLSQ